MSRTLVFHVGDCKTGTTSVQWALDKGLVRPSEKKLLFPGQKSHFPLARSLNKSAPKGLSDQRFSALRERLDAADWDVAVISSELFEYEDPALLAGAIKAHLTGCFDQLRVITYVRPHAARLVAQFAEAVKLGHHTGTLDGFHTSFVRSGKLDYAPRLRRWRDAFGDAFEARAFQRQALSQGDVVRDFFDCTLGAGTYALDMAAEQNNGLFVEDLAALRCVHQTLADVSPGLEVSAVRYAAWLSELLPAVEKGTGIEKGTGTKVKLTSAIAASLKDRFAADAAAVDSEFLGADSLQRALAGCHDGALPEPQSFDPETVLDAMTIRFLRAIVRLQAAQMRQDEDFFKRRAWAVDIA